MSTYTCACRQVGAEYTFTIRDPSTLDGIAFKVSYDAFVDDVQVRMAVTTSVPHGHCKPFVNCMYPGMHAAASIGSLCSLPCAVLP